MPYSSKAEKYARYRWRYSDQAVQMIVEIAHITPESTIADLGAGTGILTRSFASRVRRIYAVEPDPGMRKILIRDLAQFPSLLAVDGVAEATSLPQHSIDLVTAAQSLHWFEPEETRREIRRILTPGGWLAVLYNYSTDEKLQYALNQILTPENGVAATHEALKPKAQPLSFFFGHDRFIQQDFPFSLQETWEEFLGSLVSASFVPDESHPSFEKFERAAWQIFDQFSSSTGVLTVRGVTHFSLGQISP